MSNVPRIGVLSVGNVLMGDDGIGPFILKILESRYEFPPEVVLHDLGTPGLGIASFFADYDTVILLDALTAKGQPGEVKLYRKDQLVRVPISQRISPHDPALVEALLFSELSGLCPSEVLLVGIVPETVELGCSLSQAIQAAVEPAIAAVLAELLRLGVHAKPRLHAAQPSIWWTGKVCCTLPGGEADVSGYSG